MYEPRLGGPYATVEQVPTYRLPHHVPGRAVRLCTFCYDLYVEYDEDLACRWQQQERNEPQFGELCCSCGRSDQPSKENVLTQAQVTLVMAAVSGGATRSELLRVALNAWWQARHEAPPTVPRGATPLVYGMRAAQPGRRLEAACGVLAGRMTIMVSRGRRAAPAAVQPPLPFARAGDLPRFWDGRAVVWKGWREDWDRRFAPRPAMECAACGSTAEPSTNLGRVAESPLYSHAMMEADDAAAARLPPIARDKFKPRGRSFYRLMVFRCRDCGYDMVLDDTGSEWELDDDDYGPDGSWPR